MSSPNKLTLNTNPLQYKRARSKGVNKISKVSKIALIKPRTTKNTENMGYTPFKMKGASLYRSPVKDKMSTSMVSEKTAKTHNADNANNPNHDENMHGKGRNTTIADAESKAIKAAKDTKDTKTSPAAMKSPAKNTGSAYAAQIAKDTGQDASRFVKMHDDNYAKGHTSHEGGQNEPQPGSKNYKKPTKATKATKDTKTSPATMTSPAKQKTEKEYLAPGGKEGYEGRKERGGKKYAKLVEKKHKTRKKGDIALSKGKKKKEEKLYKKEEKVRQKSIKARKKYQSKQE